MEKAYRYTFGDIGALRKQLGNYIDYFRPNFHPWDHDNREYMQQMEQLIYQLSEKSNKEYHSLLTICLCLRLGVFLTDPTR